MTLKPQEIHNLEKSGVVKSGEDDEDNGRQP